MNFSLQQIESITQRVLRELSVRGVDINRQVRSSDATGETPIVAAKTTQLTHRVITEDSLASVAAAGNNVSIHPQAVITPSGRDFIRRHGITVKIGSASGQTSNSGLLIVNGSCPSISSAAAAAKWQEQQADSDYAAAQAAQLAMPSIVVCCVRQPSMVACLLNRDTQLRAAVVEPTTDISVLLQTMNPQVVCLSSTGWSFASVLRTFRLLTSSCTGTPSDWQELHTGGCR